jgi:hypothetical protein
MGKHQIFNVAATGRRLPHKGTNLIDGTAHFKPVINFVHLRARFPLLPARLELRIGRFKRRNLI